MKDYVLNKKPEPAANEMVWAFDLGKASIGEAVRRGNEFLHKASLLHPGGICRNQNRRRSPRVCGGFGFGEAVWHRPTEGNRIRKMRMAVGEGCLLNCHKLRMSYDAKPAA